MSERHFPSVIAHAKYHAALEVVGASRAVNTITGIGAGGGFYRNTFQDTKPVEVGHVDL